MRTDRSLKIGVCVLLLISAADVQACGFYTAGIVTLRDSASQSKLIVYGKLENAREGEAFGGSVDLRITQVIKQNAVLAGRQVIQLPSYIPIPDAKNPPQYLVFGDVVDGKIDPFRGVPCTEEAVDYLKQALKFDGKERVALMQFCFKYIEHADRGIADDALGEFLKSSDPEIRSAARKLPPDRLRQWLQNEKTQSNRLRLYGYLLGNCGSSDDAILLRKLLDRLTSTKETGLVDGILTGYTLLDPKEGWAFCRECLRGSANFVVRYSALRTARYFYTTHPGVVTDKETLDAIAPAFDQNDMADLAMEYLRDWKCWKHTDQILALASKKGFDAPIIQVCILRYCLQCPDEKAKKFVADKRKSDAERVADAEEFLANEVKTRP
jgi:hypothetical protein